jgi:hypothetical protein
MRGASDDGIGSASGLARRGGGEPQNGPGWREVVARGAWYADPYGAAAERGCDGGRWMQQVRGEPSAGEATPSGVGSGASTSGRWGLAPGWYPWSAGAQRYWDGEKWGAKNGARSLRRRRARIGEAQWELAGRSRLRSCGAVAASRLPLRNLRHDSLKPGWIDETSRTDNRRVRSGVRHRSTHHPSPLTGYRVRYSAQAIADADQANSSSSIGLVSGPGFVG